MLWSNPTPRHIAIGLYQALVLPWASIPLALAIGVAAAVGLLVALLREWRTLLVLSVAFLPYFVFHLLFQQLDTAGVLSPLLRHLQPSLVLSLPCPLRSAGGR